MKEIKSLADEIRASISLKDDVIKDGKEKKIRPAGDASQAEHADFLRQVSAFRVDGTEKSMIRLDEKTDRMLKLLKAASGISINKFIAFAVTDVLGRNPWLGEHIKETFKNTKL